MKNTEVNKKVDNKKSRKKLVIVLIAIIVVQLIVLAFIYRQNIEDYFWPAPPAPQARSLDLDAKIFEHKELFKIK